MSTNIAERWHRAHGLYMCWGGEAPIFNELHTHLFLSAQRISVPDLPSLDDRCVFGRALFSKWFKDFDVY